MADSCYLTAGQANRAAAVGSRVDYIRLLALFVISFLLNCVPHGSPLNYCRLTDKQILFLPGGPSVHPPVCLSVCKHHISSPEWNRMKFYGRKASVSWE